MICTTIDLDDIKQAVRMGISRANKAYTAALGGWPTYSAYFIKNELKRLKYPSIAVASLDAPLSAEDDTTLHDIVPDESLPDADAALVADETRQAVRAAVDRLPDQQRDLVKKRFWDDMTAQAAAAEMGISTDRAYKLFEHARRTLRRDRDLKRLVDELAWLPCTLTRFKNTHTSAVEWAVMRLERERMKRNGF